MRWECSPLVDNDHFVRQRRDFHAHPELAGQERRTSEIIARLLAEWGYQVRTGIRGHGSAHLVVAPQTIVSRNTIRPRRPSSPDGKGGGVRRG